MKNHMRQMPVIQAVAFTVFVGVSTSTLAGVVRTAGDQDIILDTSKGGLSLESEDGTFSFAFHGAMQIDYDRFNGVYTNNGNAGDEAEFRRLRPKMSGNYRDWAFEITPELAPSGNTIHSATITYEGFKPINLTVGMASPDFGLEKATSSNWVTATERNIGYDLASWINSSSDDLGAHIDGTFGDMFFGSASVTNRDTKNDDRDGDASRQFNGRVVFAPFHKGGNVLHFALDYAYRDLNKVDLSNTNYDIDNGLGVHGDAGDNDHDPVLSQLSGISGSPYKGQSIWGAEAAWAFGALSLQGEYLHSTLNSDDGGYADVKSKGYYGQVAYTLTGEPRDYKLNAGAFGAVRPENAKFGAWEIFYRYAGVSSDNTDLLEDGAGSVIGLNTNGSNSAKVHTFGVNWYANNNVKISVDYNYAKVNDKALENAVGDDDGNAVMTRFQFVF
ncbi:hypothetical protein AWM79_07070 [Pseudomonas agarici]|uniref:Porin n=1 Tax=Pseudomonas agarici TaxID=46677 RepID=A0A0X1SZ44_PSEAA|nr:porin [Pseudomonas agarici]AMB85083.1 hypothetical protein AWM79_07070 [Pseudomonas agarici]NWC07823.1 porin [Pseudomonas agarici]SEK75391.1 phosphate-selective porin OprO and OprP [Pseudomonas agarici]